MTLTVGPNLGLLINGTLGEAHYDLLMKALRGVDGLAQLRVLDKDRTSPPAVVDGAMYIIPAGATGAWAGKTGQLARGFTVGTAAPGWEFFVPKRGWRVSVENELDTGGVPLEYRFTGTEWKQPANAVVDTFVGGTLSRALNEAPVLSVPAEDVMDLGSVESNTVDVTGSQPINQLGVVASGAVRRLHFVDSGVIVHDVDFIILPGADAIYTQPGDVFDFQSLGGNKWRCVGYSLSSGRALTASEGAGGSVGMLNPMSGPGDLVMGGPGGAPQRLERGIDGQTLKLSGGFPEWTDVPDPMANPMTDRGDLIVGSDAGVPARLPRGANGQVLKTVAGTLTWAAESGGAGGGMDNPMTDEGDLIVGGDSGAPVRLARGADGTALRIVAGVLAWVAEGAALTNPMTTLGDIIVGADAGAPQRLGIGTEGQVLKAIGGELQWGDESGGGMTNPMTTAGDIIVAGAAGAPTRLGKGADGQVLKMVAGVLAWAAESGGGGGMVNPMTAEGDIIVGGAAGAPARLSKGSDGQVLKMVAGALAWAADAAGMTNPMTAEGDIIIGGTAGAPARLGKGTDGQVLKTVAGVLTWAAESGGGSGPANTDALAEGTANLYFTTARVLATALTGLVTNNATVVSATDTLLVAVGKLQAQVQARLQLSGGKMTGAINQATPVTVASAATVNIGATASETINITGTTTITAFDTIAAGARRRLVFGGTLILTHGPSSLILPGYANITTEVGDSADFESMGGGNWKCTAYNRVNGRPVVVGAPIPSITAANNVNIYAAGVGVVSITGTTGIGYVGTGVEGQEVTVVFTGATPLYHSASLILPGGDNVTTAAGDIAKFLFTGATGVTRCTMYTRAAEGVGAELITNANGIAMKFPDGTMICQIFGIATPVVSAGGPNIFISNTYTWTLPAAFSNANFTVSGGSKVLNRWILGQPATAGTATLRDVCYSSVAAATADLIAIGRWK